MSKLEEVLNKKAKLVERKAKEAGLTAVIAATTVLGLGGFFVFLKKICFCVCV